MRKITILLTTALVLLAASSSTAGNNTVNLAGRWAFSLDPDGIGEKQQWFAKELGQTITLPGSTAENGFGNEASLETKWTGDIQVPDWFKDKVLGKYSKPESFKFP